MKVLKPQRLALLHRVVEHERRYTLVVSVITYVPLAAPRQLLGEVSLWNELGDVVPGGVLDEGYPKPRGEVLVSGQACSPTGEPVGAVKVRLRVFRGDEALVEKELAVLGDRFWQGSTPTDPVPFVTLPIDYAHAFGGEDYAPNPTGKGIAPIATDQGPVVPLPNVEDPAELLVSPQDRPAPAGLGPYAISWPQRLDKLGRDYGKAWLAERFPGPAADFDAGFYCCAPPDQQIDGFFAGDETFELAGMHPTRATLEGALEPLVVRVFVTQRGAAGGDGGAAGEEGSAADGAKSERFAAIGTRLDTIHFFPEQERAVLVYRGTLPVAEDDAEDIVHLMVAAEDPAEPKSLEHYQQVLTLRLDKDKGALASLRDADLMPPAAAGWAVAPDYGDLAEMTRIEQRALQKAERGRKRQLAAAKAELEAAGFDVGDAFDEPPQPNVPDPHDIDGLLAFTEEMDARAAQLTEEAEQQQDKLEAEARAAFEAAGFDYEAEMERAEQQGGGPPDFSAEAQLVMLHDMARIAAEGGVPMEELEQDLMDPRYEELLHDLEARVRSAYGSFAHVMPAAAVDDERRAQLRVLVTAAKDSDESLAKRDLTGADLHGLDLSGMDLSGALLEGANLSGADLSEAKLAGAVLARADLTHADLSGADLSGANLGATRLVGTDLSGARLHETVLMRAELDGVVLHSAKLSQTDFIETTFTAADWSHAEADAPLFLQADLRNVTFTGATLTQARFIDVELGGVDFTGAQLDKATFVQARADGACFAGAKLTGASLVHETTLVDATFAGADLSRACLRKTPLTGADLEQAVAHEADLSHCDLRGANLHRLAARQALLIRADLAGANLRGADLLGAILQKAKLQGTDLTGANLSRADVSLTQHDEGTVLDEALLLDTRVDPRYRAPDDAAPGGSSPSGAAGKGARSPGGSQPEAS